MEKNLAIPVGAASTAYILPLMSIVMASIKLAAAGPVTVATVVSSPVAKSTVRILLLPAAPVNANMVSDEYS
jgi:hypothetical protein